MNVSAHCEVLPIAKSLWPHGEDSARVTLQPRSLLWCVKTPGAGSRLAGGLGSVALASRLAEYDPHLLGMHHEQLTFRLSGRNMRLTDVRGHVIHDILV